VCERESKRILEAFSRLDKKKVIKTDDIIFGIFIFTLLWIILVPFSAIYV